MKLPAALFFTALFVSPAMAQEPPNTIQLSFQLREPIAADGDTSKATAALLADAQKNCAIAAKAFGAPCTINNIQFNNRNFGPWGNPQGPQQYLWANVSATVTPTQPPQ